jgi:hypothetical protein
LTANPSKDKWWSVSQNTSNTAYKDNHDINYPSLSEGAMVFHPGPARGESSKARFTAPSDGTYTISAKWTLVDAQGSLVSTEVYSNSGGKWATLHKENLTNKTPGKSIAKEFTVKLKKGEVVSIEVECANGYGNDSTLVELSAK